MVFNCASGSESERKRANKPRKKRAVYFLLPPLSLSLLPLLLPLLSLSLLLLLPLLPLPLLSLSLLLLLLPAVFGYERSVFDDAHNVHEALAATSFLDDTSTGQIVG